MCTRVNQYSFWIAFLTAVDISEAQKACDIWWEATADDAIETLMISLSRFCDRATQNVQAYVDALSTALRFYLRMYISLHCSLSAYMIMVPAALAFGPGFVRASWKLKLILPLARLPGTLSTLFPAMYCPLLWMLYHFFFQVLNE